MATDPSDLAAELRLAYEAYDFRPRFNVPPGADIPVIVQRAGAGGQVDSQIRSAHWGLVPAWAKDLKIGFRAFNARVETVAEKPMFRRALAARRCVVAVNGYYEWEKTPAGKQPWLMSARDDAWLFMAGLFEFRKLDGSFAAAGLDPERSPSVYDGWLVSATIITRPSADHLGEVHDRMPLMLPRERIEDWTDISGDAGHAADMLGQLSDAFDPGSVVRHRVSSDVGNVRNDYEELIAAV